MLSNLPGTAVQDINRVCRYLALDDFQHEELHAEHLFQRIGARRFDLVAVFGNQVLETITRGCSLVVSQLGDRLLLSGGRGHSTPFLFDNIARSSRYGRLVEDGTVREEFSEAQMFQAIAKSEFKIPSARILIEEKSTNTGENARFSLDLISGAARRPERILVIQDPLMQRRTFLTLSQAAANLPRHAAIFSHAVFVPEIERRANGTLCFRECGDPPWQEDRFLSLLLGEIERIRNDERGYGPRGRGFIPAVEIPPAVLASFENLRRHVSAQ